MSYIDARDQLRSAGAELGYDDEWADALLARHAAELAEKIRSHPECEIGGYGDGILDASFMIDPDVEYPEDDTEED